MAALEVLALDEAVPQIRAPGVGDIYNMVRQVAGIDGTAAAPSYSFSGDTNTGVYTPGENIIGFVSGAIEKMRLSITELKLNGTHVFGFTSGTVGSALDTILARDAANTLAQRNGTNAQIDNLYGTFTDASNHERLAFKAQSADDFLIIPEAAGSGTLRGLQLVASGGRLGFYGTTAIVKPAGTGETVGFTAGAGTAVLDDSTFTGNVGATAYRISDVVKALKNLGLMTA